MPANWLCPTCRRFALGSGLRDVDRAAPPPIGSRVTFRHDGLTARGKPAGNDAGGARGLNDYTGWFAGDAAMGGQYFGYDGPYPPPHDLRTHRYFFRLFALDVASLGLPQAFTAADALRAMQGHVLGEAALYGTYSLNG